MHMLDIYKISYRIAEHIYRVLTSLAVIRVFETAFNIFFLIFEHIFRNPALYRVSASRATPSLYANMPFCSHLSPCGMQHAARQVQSIFLLLFLLSKSQNGIYAKNMKM